MTREKGQFWRGLWQEIRSRYLERTDIKPGTNPGARRHTHAHCGGDKQPAFAMVLWNEQFATGSETIDQQHRTLINNINHLESLLTDANLTPVQCEFLIGMVEFLELYARTHFNFEERCMRQHRCPVQERNKQAHEQFLKFFAEFKQRYENEGLTPGVLRTLHQLLSSWIQEHILQVDTQLRPCIKQPE